MTTATTPKIKFVVRWKCQKCGLAFPRLSPGEPRRCPQCGDKGVKTFVREGFE